MMPSSRKIWVTTCCLTLIVVFTLPITIVSAQDVSAQVDASVFQKELEKVRHEKEMETKRVEEMRLEREQFIKEIRRVENLNNKYSTELESLRAQMAEQQKMFEDRLKKIETKENVSLSTNSQKIQEVASKPVVNLVDIEKQSNEIFEKGGDLDPEDEKFKEELARAHYNMGNVYFERGEYQRAVVEYYQAVDLMPYEPDAHYNLAFVSSDYIGDHETALKHYQWYLYLSPNSDDKKFVEEKIVASKLKLRSQMDNVFDKTRLSEQSKHLNVAR